MAASSNLARGTIARIRAFNRDRDPSLVRRKYAEMRSSTFTFYRGTCHLFYEDWAAEPPVARAPDAWVSGDLHPENFGSFRGGDGDVYFDVDDFDEAALGPCVWDVARCAVGIEVGCAELGILASDIAELVRRFLYAYRATLHAAVAVPVGARDASGMVRELLKAVRKRASDAVVDSRTKGTGTRRRIRIDDVHAARAGREDVERATRIVEQFNVGRKGKRRCEVIDVAHRIAGTGSLGVARYAVLVTTGRRFRLLDVKQQPRPAVAPYLQARQPKWRSEAERVVAAQMMTQASPPYPLAPVTEGDASFVVRELQPYEDRVRWTRWHGRLERLEHLLSALGQTAASSHLRGAAKRGAAKSAELSAFARETAWTETLASFATRYARQVRADYARFAKAYDAGTLTGRG